LRYPTPFAVFDISNFDHGLSFRRHLTSKWRVSKALLARLRRSLRRRMIAPGAAEVGPFGQKTENQPNNSDAGSNELRRHIAHDPHQIPASSLEPPGSK
jgi:hypothetical protein